MIVVMDKHSTNNFVPRGKKMVQMALEPYNEADLSNAQQDVSQSVAFLHNNELIEINNHENVEDVSLLEEIKELDKLNVRLPETSNEQILENIMHLEFNSEEPLGSHLDKTSTKLEKPYLAMQIIRDDVNLGNAIPKTDRINVHADNISGSLHLDQEEVTADEDLLDSDFAEPSEGSSSESENEENLVEEEAVGNNTERGEAENNNDLKRKCNQTRRARDLNKKARMLGNDYLGLKKDADGHFKLIANKNKRTMKPGCTLQKCRNSKVLFCSEFDETERKKLFDSFWQLTWDMKKTFLSTIVDVIPSKRKVENSRRNTTIRYYLKKGTQKKRVCKTMFLSTLCVGEWMVREYANKDGGMNLPEENIQREGRKRKGLGGNRKTIKDFLSLVPKMESHYCRASTNKLYLEPIFQNKAEFYREYKNYCNEKKATSLSKTVFLEEMNKANIKIYKPRKDQCDLCISHKLGNISDEEYKIHQEKKESARREKVEDKERASNEPDRMALFCMDVQAVKLSPVLQASAIYYKTKLCVHNYTVFNMVTKDVTCFLWDESQGGLDGSIFASLLTEFLSNYISDHQLTEEIILFSDSCSYQNKNSILANAILQFSIEHKVNITHKYLQKGHTQMEVDSVHSTIERRLKNRDIYVPFDYIAVCKEARRGQPYNVKYMNWSEFKDFKNNHIYTSIRPGRKPGEPLVSDVCCFKYTPSGEIYFKINYSDTFTLLPQRTSTVSYKTNAIPLYKCRQKIKKEKYDHLQALKTVLDKEYWDFYDKLPH